MSDYETFIERKSQLAGNHGFDPLWMPDFLFPFQKSLVEWAIRKGRAAIFADCGLGKTIQQLVWAQNVYQQTKKPVIILTPLAVAPQTIREARKFGIDASISSDGSNHSPIVATNYEKLHHFDSTLYGGCVCDESSILKSYRGETRKQVTRFMSKMKYRLLCTATAAPNDWIELGTSSEALGELSHSEMLKRFFKQLDDKGQKKESRQQEEAEKIIDRDPQYFAKLAYRVAQTIGQWRLKHHAVTSFWRWVSSWARACRMPSDLGFDDTGFVLPELIERDHVLKPSSPPPGMMFSMPAIGLQEEREERRRTLHERCEYAANLVNHDKPAVVWCHMNDEARELVRAIPDSRQISAATPDDQRIEIYEDFASGKLRVLVIKPKVGAWGLNWQHCAHVVTFVSHSYEQHYQLARRCYRYGQENPVRLDVIATYGEVRVLANMRRKADKARKMFDMLVEQMHKGTKIERENLYTNHMEVPSWL